MRGKKPSSLLGSRRSRIFKEPSTRSSTLKRKQKVRFRSRYAGTVARKWSRVLINTFFTVAILGGGFWGVTSFVQFWKNSSILRVKSVSFEEGLPERLVANFPIKSNDHLMLIKTRVMEKDYLSKFPELEKISIQRNLFRNIVVSGTYRVPVARIETAGELLAIDKEGFAFSLANITNPDNTLPLVEAPHIDDRRILLSFLSKWNKDLPDFYSLIKKIETDRMRGFIVEFSDGVLIDWGPVEEADIVVRAKRVMKLREVFHQNKVPAWLTFVSSDRLVMDKNWQKIETAK